MRTRPAQTLNPEHVNTYEIITNKKTKEKCKNRSQPFDDVFLNYKITCFMDAEFAPMQRVTNILCTFRPQK